MTMSERLFAALGGGRWAPVQTGAGQITGYIEVFSAGTRWVTVPGASRFVDVEQARKIAEDK